MQLDVDRLRASDPIVLRDLYAHCRHMATKGAQLVGAEQFVDDITQDMMTHVLTRFLDVYEVGRDVDKYLVEVAVRMGRACVRKHGREVLIGVVGLDPNSATDGLEAEDVEMDAAMEQDEIDKRANAAKAVLVERLRQRRGAVRSAPTAPTRKKREDTVTAEDEKPSPRKRHRHVEYEDGPLLPTDPVWKHMRRWCDQLGIDRESVTRWHVALGEIIGIHRATAYRWRCGKTQPLPDTILAIDRLVAGYVLAHPNRPALRGKGRR